MASQRRRGYELVVIVDSLSPSLSLQIKMRLFHNCTLCVCQCVALFPYPYQKLLYLERISPLISILHLTLATYMFCVECRITTT